MRSYVVALCAAVGVVAGCQPVWAQLQGQWTPTGFLQAARELNAQVSVAGGNVLTIGGADGSGNVLASAELYNAKTGIWATAASMLAAREQFPAVTLSNGKVLVAGGLGTGSTVLAAAELFDPKTNVWSPAGALSVARFGHSATLLPNGMVLVAGGCTASDCSAIAGEAELYDPATNTWSATGSLNTARSFQTAVLLTTGKVLVIGGSAGGATSSCETYDPATGLWSPAASTNVARYLNGTTLLPDGKVLVSGGTVTRYPMNSAELFDPVTNTWTLTASMATGRYAHSSTLLADGTVILAGGIGQSISCGKDCTGYIPTAKAEIYSEATGFSAAPSLPRALAYQATTALASGRALVDGGSGYNVTCCQVVSDAAVYTPLTLTFSQTSLNLGFVQLGLTGAAQMVTVTNVSTHASSFSSIASAGDFSQTNTCPATLAPQQSCAITISFTPTVAGARKGMVTLQDDDPGSPKQTIVLTGVGETLALSFSPASLNLGSVPVTLSSTQSTTLINDGAAPVTLTGISIAPSNHTFTQTNNCPTTLAVQQSCTVQVLFTPPDVAKYKATLSVPNSAGAVATLGLKGTGLDSP